MSDERGGVIHSSTEGGVAGAHPAMPAFEVFVGPATSEEGNAIRTAVIPIACWRVEDVRFEFDSSFVRPEMAKEIGHLRKLREAHRQVIAPRKADDSAAIIFPPLSIFGHADPTGNDDYNKQLSGRRAQAVYGMLTRETKLWEELFSQPAGGDKWGVQAIQTMLVHLGFSRGGVSGKPDEATRDAVTRFQKVKGLAADGTPGPATRAKLFLTYMDALCGADFVLDKNDDFLARGADGLGGKGDYQGCSEFNPVMLFSQQEHEKFKQPERKATRDAENSPNRRVMVLLFRPGSKVNVHRWPCPRAREGVAGCLKRFWSDGERRRSSRLPAERREFQKSADTFACRFYDRLTRHSPCEVILKTFSVRLYSPMGRAIPLAPCEIIIGTRQPFSDRADARGFITLRDVEVPATCKIRWGFPANAGEEPELIFSLNLFLKADEALESDRAEESRRKLNNLGYNRPDFEENVRSFQRDYGHLANPPLELTGEVDDRTLKALREVYEQSADDLRNTPVS